VVVRVGVCVRAVVSVGIGDGVVVGVGVGDGVEVSFGEVDVDAGGVDSGVSLVLAEAPCDGVCVTESPGGEGATEGVRVDVGDADGALVSVAVCEGVLDTVAVIEGVDGIVGVCDGDLEAENDAQRAPPAAAHSALVARNVMSWLVSTASVGPPSASRYDEPK
jgi:hypothetical protein